MIGKETVKAAITARGWADTDRQMREKTGTDCQTCWGYGIWAWGDPVPMGPMDAKDGTPADPCPECGAGGGTLRPNP